MGDDECNHAFWLVGSYLTATQFNDSPVACLDLCRLADIKRRIKLVALKRRLSRPDCPSKQESSGSKVTSSLT